jgi:hypothetical protein
MNRTITTTLSAPKLSFLESYAKKIGKPKNYVLEQGLELLEQHTLEEAIRAWFEERISEYRDLNEDFARAQITSMSK